MIARRANLVVVALLLAVVTEPALSCSFVNREAAIADAARTALSYYVVTAACGALLIALEQYRRRTSALSVLSVILLVFHPYWWHSTGYVTSCSFPIATDSQVVFAVIAVMLATRILRLRSA